MGDPLRGLHHRPEGMLLVDGKRKDYDGYQGHFALTAHRYQDVRAGRS